MSLSIPEAISLAIGDGRLTSEEVTSLKTALKRGQLTPAVLKILTLKYGDLFGVGAGQGLVELAPGGNAIGVPPLRSLGDSRASADVLAGAATLSRGSKHPGVLPMQRALNALANRMEKPEFGLLKSGADGVYGAETVAAVTAFQRYSGLPETGAIDQLTALTLEALLFAHPAPDVGGVAGGPVLPDGDKIALVARELVERSATDYGTAAAWRSPNPTVPGNTRPGDTTLGARGRWKCNLFAMDSLYLGGARPPQYAGGNYPIAIELPNYATGPNAPFIKVGEVWTTRGTPEEAKARIEALMRIARPGDIIVVNHQGVQKADGGHTRVVVANNFATDGTVECAQAGEAAARLRAETIDSFTGEEAFCLLRPAQPGRGVERPTPIADLARPVVFNG